MIDSRGPTLIRRFRRVAVNRSVRVVAIREQVRGHGEQASRICSRMVTLHEGRLLQARPAAVAEASVGGPGSAAVHTEGRASRRRWGRHRDCLRRGSRNRGGGRR